MRTEPCGEPLTVAVEDRVIVVDGCEGIALTLTVDEAIATADNLLDQVTLAKGQAAMDTAKRGDKRG